MRIAQPDLQTAVVPGAIMMLDAFKQLLINQYEASLCTLAHCAERCPDAMWNAPVAKYSFDRVLFHTLFYADYYLGPDAESFRTQPFHAENRAMFGDYQPFDDREPESPHTREAIDRYAEFCRGKATTVLREETEQTLVAAARFPRKQFTRAELHVYNIRHIQHHAAQLILRLRIDAGVDVPWIGSAWRDPAVRS